MYYAWFQFKYLFKWLNSVIWSLIPAEICKFWSKKNISILGKRSSLSFGSVTHPGGWETLFFKLNAEVESCPFKFKPNITERKIGFNKYVNLGISFSVEINFFLTFFSQENFQEWNLFTFIYLAFSTFLFNQFICYLKLRCRSLETGLNRCCQVIFFHTTKIIIKTSVSQPVGRGQLSI